ncbi:cytochrome P450 4C1 isoform X2 [Leptinotarsa decemlineata]|uniref:cytochrome P450 4C1 isoform X2 n=1 Tax=Leptinotarsa decemlineata TaxID=7539 RepID=UPI003D30D6ED
MKFYGQMRQRSLQMERSHDQMDISIFTEENIKIESLNLFRYYLMIFLAVTALVWYAQFLWKRRNLYIHSWKVDGPFSLPFIGCGYLILGKTESVISIILKLQNKIPSKLLRMWLGPRLIYFVVDPEHIEKVLNHPKALDKEPVYKYVANVIGLGLLTAPVKKWKYHRKLLAPSFNQKILDTFVEVFAEQSITFADQLKTVIGQKKIDLYLLASRCTLDIICQTAMGVNMNIQKEKGTYGVILDRAMEILTYRIFRVWYHVDLLWNFSPSGRILDRCMQVIQDITGSVVSKKIDKYKKDVEFKQSCTDAEIEEEPVYKRLAFLDLILKNSVFTELELREEVDIMLAAGTETTASSICCLFTMLGMYPDIQQKVYEEVIDILGPDRTVVASDLAELKYTERVIKENLRLFPIAAIFARSIEEDIDIGDAILPAGSSVAFNTVHIHRNPEYWVDPLKFDPDRFSPEEVAKRHPCTYIPFSYGPRNCIGWKYAIANIKTIISTVIRRYRIFTEYKSIEEIDLKINLLLRMKDGPKVWLEYRGQEN